MRNNVIDLNDSVQSALVKMSQGNPGAVSAIMAMLNQDLVTGFVDLCHMDDRQIRGSKIWLVYKDICNFDVTKMRELVRDRSNDLEELLERIH